MPQSPRTKEEAIRMAEDHWTKFLDLSSKNAEQTKQAYHRSKYRNYTNLAKTLPSEKESAPDLSWKPARRVSDGSTITGHELPLHENILIESRLDFLKDTVKDISTDHDDFAEHKDAKSIIDHFAEHADPSKKKIYTQWIVNRYKDKDFRQEDTDRIKESLGHFDSHKAKLEKKDIGQYKSLNEVEDAVAPHIGTHTSKSAEDKAIKEEGATKLLDTDSLSVHQIHTHDAACRYGAGTKWCTASKDNPSMFNNYSKQGPLFVFRDKKEDKKFQFHAESGQFMNVLDNPENINEFVDKHPDLKNVDELRNQHPAFESDYSKLLENSKANGKYANRAIPSLKADDAVEIYKTHPKDISVHSLLKNKNLSSGHIDKIYDQELEKKKKTNSYLPRNEFYEHPKASNRVRELTIPNDSHSIANSKSISPAHLIQHIKNPKSDRAIIINSIAHPNATKEVHDHVIDNPTYQGVIAKHKKASPEHLEKLAGSEFSWIRSSVAANKKTPKHVIENLKNDSEPSVQEAALKNKKK